MSCENGLKEGRGLKRMSVSSGAIGAGPGNTSLAQKRRRVSASKRWCFTLNNYTEDELGVISTSIASLCRYGCYGLEVGESGTPHVQGYLEFKERRRPMSTSMSKRIHWELARGTKIENIEYCSKEGLSFVYPIPYKTDIKLRPWQLRILDVLKEKPDDRTITWVWEPDGCSGKTTFQKYVFTHLARTVVLSGKGSDMKQGIAKYYEACTELPEIVLINIPRSCTGFLSYSGIEEIKDMFFYSPKYEGCMVCGACPHVVVFANCEPEYERMSSDRWNVIEVSSEMDEVTSSGGSLPLPLASATLG